MWIIGMSPEKVKIASLDDLSRKDYSLQVSGYIEKRARDAIDPAEVKKEYFAALEAVTAAEENLRALLVEGGYINE